MHVSTDPGGVGGIQTVELTEGVRFKPCGHAFTRESVDEIVELCEQWETDRREIMREYRHPEETRELLTLGSETFMREVRNTYERVEAADRTNSEDGS